MGEIYANKFLIKKGYKILDKNYRCKIGEVDIIAKDKEYLVFIEVKTRYSLKYGYPCESVTKWKQKNIIRVAQHYLKKKDLYNQSIRFDVIEILIDQNQKPWVRHMENSFWG